MRLLSTVILNAKLEPKKIQLHKPMREGRGVCNRPGNFTLANITSIAVNRRSGVFFHKPDSLYSTTDKLVYKEIIIPWRKTGDGSIIDWAKII